MIKKVYIFLFLLSGISVKSQSPLAKNGTIITAENVKIEFNDIRLVNGKFLYYDLQTNTEKQIEIKNVKYIEDGGKSRVFSNKSVIDRTKEADQKAEEEEKKKNLEKNSKLYKEMKKIEDEREKPFRLVPDGIYKSKEDFLNKTPSSFEQVTPKGLYGFEKPILNTTVNNCFFYYSASDNKIKNVFAIAHKGHLYFQIYAVLNNRNKTDRAQTNDHPNSFVRVINAGEHYYYLEVDLVNQWAKGFAINAGAIGGAIESSLHNLKGIVWDIANKEFNIFKNCDDYNEFIKDKYPKGIQECNEHLPDLIKVREAIEQIK